MQEASASESTGVNRDEGISRHAPHYQLTIERVRTDECKAMIWEGVSIETDLAGDLGLTGTYTVTVRNPVSAKGETGP